MVACSQLGFSSKLHDTISKCRQKVDEWVEREKSAADEMEKEYQRTLQHEQSAIDKLEEQLLSVKFKLGIDITDDENSHRNEGIVQRQQKLLRKQKELEAEIANLKQQREVQDELVQDLEKEEQQQQRRAGEVRSKKEMAEQSKKITVADLTIGALWYKKYSGLGIESFSDGKLRFTFSQIDPMDPKRPFSFVFGVDDNGIYQVEDCSPPLDFQILDKLVRDVNAVDTLEYEVIQDFAVKMRSAFAESL